MPRHALLASAAALLLARHGAAARQNPPFIEGPVVQVYSIRTEAGKFDEYVAFLRKIWKPTNEAAKQFGYIIDYQVIKVEPRDEDDPDIQLVVYYKNWAALDDGAAKAEAVAKAVEGSLEAANQSTVSRGSIRRILGSWTGQQLILK
jgi:hypothetical protein